VARLEENFILPSQELILKESGVNPFVSRQSNRRLHFATSELRNGRQPMGVLMLTCSITGRDFSTDIHVDEDSFSKLPDNREQGAPSALRPDAQLVAPRGATGRKYPAEPLGRI
jgi:hypothetical protein